MRAYKLRIPAGALGELNAGGNYVRLNSAQIGLVVTVSDPDGNSAAVLQLGDSLTLKPFGRLQISHDSAAEQTITVYVGTDSRLESSRIAGIVEVISGELQRVKNDLAYWGPGNSAPVAATYSSVQLFNPAVSGVNMFVNSVVAMAGAAGAYCSARSSTVALSGLVGVGASKRMGGAASVAEIRTENPASPIGSAAMHFGLGAAYESKLLPFSEPIMLRPGYGLIVGASVVDVSIWASFQWIEEAI